MMNKLEFLLVNLAEECSEVQQAATKAIRFGLNNPVPGKAGKTNKDDILTEFYHVAALMEMLQQYGYIDKPEYYKALNMKRNKKNRISRVLDKMFKKDDRKE